MSKESHKKTNRRKYKNAGYIYVLRNPAYRSDWLKIGLTTRSVEKRVRELNGATGVPMPFEIVHTCQTLDCHLAEKKIHRYFDRRRPNGNREFFQVRSRQAIKVVDKICRQVDDFQQNKGMGGRFKQLLKWSVGIACLGVIAYQAQAQGWVDYPPVVDDLFSRLKEYLKYMISASLSFKF